MPEYGEPLTKREKEILRLVATGVTNRQIAHRLSISVNTVKVHLRNVFTKLGTESRTEATMVAVREGWVSVESAEKALGGDATALSPSTPPIVPEPPLPWPKRVMLIAALLLVAAGVATTQPHGRAQDGPAPDLPPDQPRVQSGTVLPVEDKESLWHEQAQMPTRRAYLALVAVENRLLAIGGLTPEGVTAAVETYDPENDDWTPGSDKPTPVAYVSGAVIGTEVYVPGGCDAGRVPTQTVEVYDAQSDSWRESRPLPEPRCAYALTALNERLYLFGGWDGERYVTTVYVYDPQGDIWTEGRPMHAGRGLSAAAPLAELIYVVGGYDGEREMTTCTIYDPEATTWATCAPLAVGRAGLGLVAMGSQLYAIGGGGWTSHLGFNERYNLADDTWNVIETPLTEEWRSPGTVALETTIYAIGGWNGDYLSLNQAYAALPFRIFIPVSHQQ
ncbi:MAG: LuxR C-terminal-related transcriptional regulator [Chloroflexota bacterium]|nr:LuxR C-terminal-related transcriptional regulator [Chloroflexota bacterium]